MEKVFVIMSAERLTDRIKELIGKGEVEEANHLWYLVKAFQQKVVSFLQEKGLAAYSTIPCYLTFQCHEGDAEEIISIFEGYKQQTEGKVACGIGLDWIEASKALKKSRFTHNVELYDPEIMKSDEFNFALPVNMTDPKSQEYHKPKKQDIAPILAPDAKQQMQLEQGYLQSLAQQFMPQQQPQPQQPQQQPQQPQAQDPNQPRRSLLETITGQSQQGQSQQPQQAQVEKDEAEETDTSPETKGHLDHIGESLVKLKEQIPQLMDLAERNPTAFKQTMALVQKMLTLAKQKVKKAEHSEMEDLVKAINTAAEFHGKYPIGTVKHKKKKVLVNGKVVWRSVASGMVQDSKGNPISVKSHNAQADGK